MKRDTISTWVLTSNLPDRLSLAKMQNAPTRFSDVLEDRSAVARVRHERRRVCRDIYRHHSVPVSLYLDDLLTSRGTPHNRLARPAAAYDPASVL